MKNIIILSLILGVAGGLGAQSIADQKEAEGVDKDQNYEIIGTRSDTISGSLDASSPTWDRVYTFDPADPNCGLASTDSSSDGVYYAAYEIQVSAAENLEAEITSFTGGDTVMALYCDPFDPTQPATNMVAYDDDGGVTPLSAFFDADGIALTPGVSYWLVISTFSAGVVGDFEVDLTSATVVVVPVELQSFSVE